MPSSSVVSWNAAPASRPRAIVERFASNSMTPFSISPSRWPENSTKLGAPLRPGRYFPVSIEKTMASPDGGCAAVSNSTNGRSRIGLPGKAVTLRS